MTSEPGQTAIKRKTPADASEFEREQLRFFLSGDDLAATLASVNPSLAWLPVLSQMKLIQNETQLIAWIERNFADADALRDVVENIRFFGPETANFLEYRLNGQAAGLSPLIRKSWGLALRHMRTAKQGLALNEWYEIAPQIGRGDYSPSLLERLASALRPKLRVSKRLSWHKSDKDSPERPSDLMAIDYEVDDSVPSDEVLAAWPEDAPSEVDAGLLAHLSAALIAALADATDAGVESNEGYSTSDTDVPSVGRHGQNEYRSGFQIIVRVIAEVWTRLAEKSPGAAQQFVEQWRASTFRLIRRIAVFACANPAVSRETAADVLLTLPLGELFLTSSSVEVHRLIRARWNDFPQAKQSQILVRLREGPPRSWFKPDSEIDRYVDRSRFDILSDMVRNGLDVGAEATELLEQIQARWPQWEMKPAEQAGFQIWHSSGTRISGDTADLAGVSDDKLVAEARRIVAAKDFMDGDSWHALCLEDPDRALRGLKAAAAANDWPREFWHQLLWARKAYADPGTRDDIARLLLAWPPDVFGETAPAASAWLDEHAKTLPEELLWPLWDRIADIALTETGERDDA